jgi:hypothetical protein
MHPLPLLIHRKSVCANVLVRICPDNILPKYTDAWEIAKALSDKSVQFTWKYSRLVGQMTWITVESPPIRKLPRKWSSVPLGDYSLGIRRT